VIYVEKMLSFDLQKTTKNPFCFQHPDRNVYENDTTPDFLRSSNFTGNRVTPENVLPGSRQWSSRIPDNKKE